MRWTDGDRSMRAVKGSLGLSLRESEGEGHAATPVFLFQSTIVGVVDSGERTKCFRLSEKSHWFSERNENAAGDCFSILMLLNADLALLPPHILHDLINICWSDGVNLRHVAEFPVVRLDAVGGRPFEGLIPVMVWLIDLMR
jgi:hypothetical protein